MTMSGWTTLAVMLEPTLTVMPEACMVRTGQHSQRTEREMTSGSPEAEVTVVLPAAMVGE